jgi:hypothetical protein
VTDDPCALVIAVALIVGGQILNLSAFYRLGPVGVFYGDRLGYAIPWCREFPFSWLAHPQYVGAVLTIWGAFVAARFPHDDWLVLPALETVLYAASTWLEERGRRPQRASPPLRGRSEAAVRSGRPRLSPARALRALVSRAGGQQVRTGPRRATLTSASGAALGSRSVGPHAGGTSSDHV